MDPAVAVESLCVTYRGGFRSPPVDAILGLDLTVAPGEIVGVLGPNGSGKTTLLRALAGTVRPRSGRARVLGRAPRERALARRVGYQPEGPLPFPRLSARELLAYLGELMELPRPLVRARAEVWLERLGLTCAGARAIGTYSTGMARRLAIAAALLADPALLLLDEPTAGLDPAGSLAVMRILEERAAEGCAVLMASHHLQEVEQTCARVYLLDGGRCRAHGTLDDLLGTGERSLVVSGLDEAGLEQVRAAVARAGGRIVRTGREREHLFALFRRLGE